MLSSISSLKTEGLLSFWVCCYVLSAGRVIVSVMGDLGDFFWATFFPVFFVFCKGWIVVAGSVLISCEGIAFPLFISFDEDLLASVNRLIGLMLIFYGSVLRLSPKDRSEFTKWLLVRFRFAQLFVMVGECAICLLPTLPLSFSKSNGFAFWLFLDLSKGVRDFVWSFDVLRFYKIISRVLSLLSIINFGAFLFCASSGVSNWDPDLEYEERPFGF